MPISESDFGLFGIKIKVPKIKLPIKVSPPPFVKDALKVAGAPVKLAAKGVGGVGKLAGKIPIVGTPVSALYDVTVGAPFKVADGIVRGKRIDKVAYENLQNAVKNAQTLAPYAQSVVSLVPGVGTGAAGIIGAANALSKGRPITEAIVQGVRGAVPGGAAGQAIFDVAYAGVSGKPITEVALSAIPIPADQKKLLIEGTKIMKDIAAGKRVDQIAMDRVMANVPSEYKHAFQTGMAVAQGQNLQKVMAKAAPTIMKKLDIEGSDVIKKDALIRAGYKAVNGSRAKQGYAVGIGALTHKQTPTSLVYTRKALSPARRRGFDIAVATRVGQSKVVPPKGKAAQQVGYVIAAGAQDANAKQQKSIIRSVARNPQVKQGIKVAVKKNSKKNSGKAGFWARIKKMLRLS